MEIHSNRVEFGPDLTPECTLRANRIVISGKGLHPIASATIYCVEDCPMNDLFIKEELPWTGETAVETIDLGKRALQRVIGGCPKASKAE